MSDEIIWTEERKTFALASCKKWHGTPHQNRIAILGVGIDCAQFVNEVLVDSGIIERQQFGGYNIAAGMHNVSDQLERVIVNCLNVRAIKTCEKQFGDIAIFKTGIRSGHLGFCDDVFLWHALSGQSVTRSDFRIWRGEIEVLYRLTKIGLKNSPQSFI